MSGCLRLPRPQRALGLRRLQSQRRWLGTPSSVEHVRVPCASSGDITVSLHNVARHDTATPLLILIPPFSQTSREPSAPLPSVARDYPTAVINYRWQPVHGDERPEPPLHWPTPLHDVHFGYSWITANLGSGTDGAADARPAYVYGSYLGASLAAALALTESHVPARSLPMTVRGLVTHNGIFNWTMFLPDHPVHRPKPRPKPKGGFRGPRFPLIGLDDPPVHVEEDGIFAGLKHQAPALFSEPANLFDPFASACLFFHSADLHVPDDFTTPLSPAASLPPQFTAAVDALAGRSPAASATDQSLQDGTGGSSTPTDDETAESLLARAATLAKLSKPPRKGYLVFPPRHSTLRLPSSLFLYDRPRGAPVSPPDSPSFPGFPGQKPRRRGGPGTSRNNFRVQALELAGLMSRSLHMFELRPRPVAPWEGDEVRDEERARMSEIERRVQTCEVEPRAADGELALDREAEEVVAEWLRERIDEDFGGE